MDEYSNEKKAGFFSRLIDAVLGIFGGGSKKKSDSTAVANVNARELSRIDLLEMLVELGKENARLKAEIEDQSHEIEKKDLLLQAARKAAPVLTTGEEVNLGPSDVQNSAASYKAQQKAAEAEARAFDAERKAAEAAARVAEAEQRALKAEAMVEAAELRAREAEEKAADAELRVQKAESVMRTLTETSTGTDVEAGAPVDAEPEMQEEATEEPGIAEELIAEAESPAGEAAEVEVLEELSEAGAQTEIPEEPAENNEVSEETAVNADNSEGTALESEVAEEAEALDPEEEIFAVEEEAVEDAAETTESSVEELVESIVTGGTTESAVMVDKAVKDPADAAETAEAVEDVLAQEPTDFDALDEDDDEDSLYSAPIPGSLEAIIAASAAAAALRSRAFSDEALEEEPLAEEGLVEEKTEEVEPVVEISAEEQPIETEPAEAASATSPEPTDETPVETTPDPVATPAPVEAAPDPVATSAPVAAPAPVKEAHTRAAHRPEPLRASKSRNGRPGHPEGRVSMREAARRAGLSKDL